jgi:RimJ/RimL family protein N-acetyltransferase
MKIELRRVDRDVLAALKLDATRIDGMKVIDGELPPDFLLESAAEAFETGEATWWTSPFVFIAADAHEVVGSGAFKAEPCDGSIELGYGIAPSRRGLGYATAGVEQMLRLVFVHSEIDVVRAETAVDNVASRRVVEKAGFRLAGRRLSEEDGMVDCWFIDRSFA